MLRWISFALVDTKRGCRNLVKRCTSAGVLRSAGVSCNLKKTTNDASVKGASDVLVSHQLICAQVLQVAELLAGDRSSGYVR